MVREALGVCGDLRSDPLDGCDPADRRGSVLSEGARARRRSQRGDRRGQTFLGQCSGGAGLDGDEWHITLDAGGYCLDGRATEVIGVTTEGRRFTSPVCNGFWVLVVEDPTPHPNPMLGPLAGWEEITARNSSGKVLHRLDLGRQA